MRPGVAVVLVLLLSGSVPALAQPLFGASGDPTAGALVFSEKKCVTCHSIAGKGGGRIGPDLAAVTRARSFYDLAAALWNHAPRMAARMREARVERPVLTPQESGNLAAYLYTFNYFDRPGDAAVGKTLFTTKRCVQCHKVGATGGSVGPHFDNYDVFLLQAEGQRRWKIGQMCDADSKLLAHADLRILADFEQTDEWVLEPGDMLYLPPRLAHYGIAEDDCMTYSVGFRAPSAAEVLTHFTDFLAQFPVHGSRPSLYLCTFVIVQRILQLQRFGDVFDGQLV